MRCHMHANNVEGTERLLSLAVGIMGVASGIKQGGIRGLIKIAASTMIAKRGITGHCQLKGLLSACEREGTQDERGASAPERDGGTAPKASSQLQDRESRMDNALEETFPASDPISP
ncbi:DUF2892 domain-containing protein [Pseudomonas daroniae]|nr:DUF2892 domain-containing protein [Pseudomonas daroniae]